MTTSRQSLLLLPLLALALAPYLGAQQQEPREPVRADWLDAGVANAELLMRILPPAGGLDTERLLAELGGVDRRVDASMGLGGRRLSWPGARHARPLA